MALSDALGDEEEVGQHAEGGFAGLPVRYILSFVKQLPRQ